MRQKCDEKRPSCSMCIKRGIKCQYLNFQIYGQSTPKVKLEKLEVSEDETNDKVSDSSVDRPNGELWWYGPYSDWLKACKRVCPLTLSQEELFGFLKEFFLQSNFLFNFPFIRSDHNELMDTVRVLGSKYSVLDNVIYTVTSNALETQCKDSRWNKVKAKFMDVSYGHLVKLIAQGNTFGEDVCTLFAIMLLFSERSTSYSTIWRAHLKGASGLLQRYKDRQIHTAEAEHDPELKAVETLYCASRVWFASSETAAWLSSTQGGIMTDREDLSQLLDSKEFAKLIPGAVVNGFNLGRGFGMDLDDLFSRTVLLVFDIQRDSISSEEVESVAQQLLTELDQVDQMRYQFSEDQYDQKWTDFFNMSHQLYCKGLRLYIFLKILKRSCYSLKPLMLQSIALADRMPFRECLGIGIHWPLYMAGLCAVEIEHRAAIEDYLQEIVSRGIHVARVSLDRLRRCWEAVDFDVDPSEADFDSVVL